MHMADALLSPAVGGAMWAASAGAIACCSARLGREQDERKVPLMGVLGAFLFAAQMINFSIPGTGSSGHLSGGLLLAILLGPCAAFLTMASVLVVQALFFADGGLLALGCNIFNLGFVPAFLVYPLFYGKLIGSAPSRARLTAVTLFCAVLGLQLGSFAVVLETLCSGISSLPFAAFALLMQPIHLAIGLVEGAVTVALVSFVLTARPDLLNHASCSPADAGRPVGRVLVAFLACALLSAALLSGFASQDPDGLEWSVAQVTGQAGFTPPERGIYRTLAALQESSAWFPDYGFKTPAAAGGALDTASAAAVDGGIATGVAGLAGTGLTLFCVLSLAWLLKRRSHGIN